MKRRRLKRRLRNRIRSRLFRVTASAALFFYKAGLPKLGRAMLRMALSVCLRQPNFQKRLYMLVMANAALLNDPKTREMLLSPDAKWRDLGLLLCAVHDQKTGDLDSYLVTSERAYLANPQSDFHKFVKLGQAHVMRDRDMVQSLVKEIDFQRGGPAGWFSKRERLAVCHADNATNLALLREKMRLAESVKGYQDRFHPLQMAGLALNCQEFQMAADLAGTADYGAEYETTSFHVHHAINSHFGRHADTKFFNPAHLARIQALNIGPMHPTLLSAATKLDAARQKYDQSDFPPVAFLCPLHRSRDLAPLLEQIQSQTIDNAVAYLVINNCDASIDEAAIYANWSGRAKLKIFNIGEMPNLSTVMLHALDLITEDFVVKFDADCLYGPNYATDMVGQSIVSGCDIIVKRAKFRYFETSGLLDIEAIDQHHRMYTKDDWAGGSTICASLKVMKKHIKTSRIEIGEDVAFLAHAFNGGRRIYLADPFNHISVRNADRSLHTFQRSSISEAVGKGKVTICSDDIDFKTRAYR